MVLCTRTVDSLLKITLRAHGGSPKVEESGHSKEGLESLLGMLVPDQPVMAIFPEVQGM